MRIIYFYNNKIIKEFKKNKNKDKEKLINKKLSLIFILYYVEIIKGKVNNETFEAGKEKNDEKIMELEIDEEDEERISNSKFLTEKSKKGRKPKNNKQIENKFLSHKTNYGC